MLCVYVAVAVLEPLIEITLVWANIQTNQNYKMIAVIISYVLDI